MDEAVASTDFLEENATGGFVEKAHVVTRDDFGTPQEQAEDAVSQGCQSTTHHAYQESATQPGDPSVAQPALQKP